MRERIFLVIMILVFILLSSLGINSLPAPYGDNGRYIVVAKSILQGKGLTKINYPQEPPDTKIAPLYPLLLALLIHLFGYNLVVLKASSILFLMVSLLFFFLFINELKISRKVGLFSLLFISLNPFVLEYSRVILTEASFTFFVVLTTFCFIKYEKINNKNFLYFGLMLSVISFFIRYVGILLIIPITIILIAKKEYKSFLVSILLFLSLFSLWIYKGLSSSETYLADFLGKSRYLLFSQEYYTTPLGIFKRYIRESMAYLGNIFPNFVLPPLENISPWTRLWIIKIPIALCVLIAVFYGYLRLWRNHKIRFFLLFPLIYIIALPAFPIYGIRFLVPISFFLILFFIYGLKELPILKKTFVLVPLVIILSFFYLFSDVNDLIKIKQGFSKEWKGYYQSLLYLKDNSKKEDIIICRKPFLGYLLSERKTHGYLYSQDIDETFQYIKKSKANYVIVDSLEISGIPFSKKYLRPVLEKYKDNFVLVYKTPPINTNTQVYKIEIASY